MRFIDSRSDLYNMRGKESHRCVFPKEFSGVVSVFEKVVVLALDRVNRRLRIL
jgi:hypothetical protein